MNYPAYYNRLIDRARGRVLTVYKERHHVLPRCMGGTDSPDNLVDLTAEEHYVAHQLLVKMYPDNTKLAHAAVWMARRASGNKAYSWLRRKHAQAASENLLGNKHWIGKKHTPAWRARMSKSMLGKKMPAEGIEKMAATKRGKPLSPEHRAKISAVHRGKPKSAEHRNKIANAHCGMKLSAEARAKISEANRQRIFTPEIRANMSAAREGKKPFLGRRHSLETKARMSASHISSNITPK
jgi:hypothetical protein